MTKIDSARSEYASWCSSLGIDSLSSLNACLNDGQGASIIKLSEEWQERKYSEIAEAIASVQDRCPIVMMSGPSSSGKTSSSLRIAACCRAIGLNPKVIELDNYFHNREDTPRDENGDYDFEALGAMDVNLLGRQLNALMRGEQVELPRYDFVSGDRVFDGKMLRLDKGDILFMEGIHALNPDLTPTVDQNCLFKIYISALSTLPSSGQANVSTTDVRLLRRIIRDNRTRGLTPEQTIVRWPSVRRGETRYVFPYEEYADIAFNSSALYDLPVLKAYAGELLAAIPEDSAACPKAQELLRLLSAVVPLSSEEIESIPANSIVREFIGGQVLER